MSTIFPAPYKDYSSRDQRSIETRIFDLITSVFPRWTTRKKHNFGNVLVGAFSFVGDIFGFYFDKGIRETRFGTITQRKNMIAAVKLIDYELPGATAATADVRLILKNLDALTGSVLLAKGTKIRTVNVTTPVRGELQSDVVVDVATGEAVGGWKHSISQDPYTVPSTELPDFEVYLPFGPYLDGSMTVSTPSQSPWVEVDNFLESGPSDFHFTVAVDHLDRATARFGDGNNGAIPVGDVTFNWEVGGGVDGNVEAGALTVVEGDFFDTAGTRAYVESYNDADASGGFPREEVDGAAVNAPASLRVLNRTVAREDYEINATNVDGVGRALMLTSDQQAGIPENRGQLYIIPVDGGTPSTEMKQDVYDECTIVYPNTITFDFDVLDGVYLTINIEAWLYFSQGYDKVSVRTQAVENLEDFFEPMLASNAPNPNVDFGYNYKDEDGNPAGEIAWSDIFNIVRDTDGVRKIEPAQFLLNGAATDVAIPNWQFPALGTVVIIDARTGTQV